MLRSRQELAESRALNVVNRSVYISDNLPFLKSLDSETIDLVCIDPPFAKNETFGQKKGKQDPLKPPLTASERQTELDLLARWGIHTPDDATKAGIDWPGTVYKDFWSWEQDIHEEWMEDIKNDYPAVNALIEATRMVHSDDTAAYLCYMAVRLFEIRRVLKDTGSLYLHCDHTAGAYLRQLLDGIFGNQHMRREIVWDIAVLSGYKAAANNWIRGHDTILYYTKSENFKFSKQTQPHRKEYLDRFNKIDEAGEHYFDGRGKRRYLSEVMSKGKAVGDVWNDIMSFQQMPTATERIGYPTQKPVALAERIIKASCPEDGVVLDCFAGCAYVAVAAERLGCQWLACDINPRAWTVFKRQFNKPKLALLECRESTEGQQVMIGQGEVTVHGPNELPLRTSPDEEAKIPTISLKERTFKVPSSDILEREMLEILLRLSGWQAWCCGFANRKSDWTVVRTTRNFHLDHQNPKSRPGFTHMIENRAPMCPHHNIYKSNRRIHLDDYRREITIAGEMMIDDIDSELDLTRLVNQAIYAAFQWRLRHNPQMEMLSSAQK